MSPGRFVVLRADQLQPRDLVSDPSGGVWHVDHVVVSESECVQVNLREMRQVSPDARLVVWRAGDCPEGDRS